MNIRTYLNEKIENAKKQSLFESIQPIVANMLQESINEKKKFKKGKNNKNGKISVDKLVKKLMKNDEFKKKALEYLTDDDAYDGWSEALNGKTYNPLDNLSDGSKRRIVTQRLEDKKIDYAPISYKLWPNMSKDAARSWFSKKVAGKNESFTNEEIAQIYNLLNNKI